MARLRAGMGRLRIAPTTGDRSSTNMLTPLVNRELQQAARHRRRKPASEGKFL